MTFYWLDLSQRSFQWLCLVEVDVCQSWTGVEIVSKLVSCSPDDWVWPGDAAV